MVCSSRSFIMLGPDLPVSSSRRSEVGMRGTPEAQHPLYYVIDVEALIPADHPLRAIKRRVDGREGVWASRAGATSVGGRGVPDRSAQEGDQRPKVPAHFAAHFGPSSLGKSLRACSSGG